MEKMLWMAVAVLWMSLLGGVALGSETRNALDYPASNEPVVRQAALVTPVRSVAADRVIRPVVEFGQQGTGELAGAALIGAGFVFRALRRRGLV